MAHPVLEEGQEYLAPLEVKVIPVGLEVVPASPLPAVGQRQGAEGPLRVLLKPGCLHPVGE